MHFKFLCAFFALILPVAVVASPVADVCRILTSTSFIKLTYLYLQVSNDLVDLHARAFNLEVKPAAKGDYAKIAGPAPVPPEKPLDKSCPDFKKLNADWKKISAKCATYAAMEAQFKARVIPSVTRLLHAAESDLHLTGLNVLALVKSSYHASDPKVDPLEHWTFTFEAPACGKKGEVCTGHSYDPDKAPIGTIWSANHDKLFPKCK